MSSRAGSAAPLSMQRRPSRPRPRGKRQSHTTSPVEAVQPAHGGKTEALVDWEALWLEANGPSISEQDLALLKDVFLCFDPGSTGLLQRDKLSLLCQSFADLCGEGVELDGDGGLQGSLDAREWVAFNAAAASACGQKAWRRALDELAAVHAISRPVAPEQDAWVIRRGEGGAICSKWFSHVELQPQERHACRALKGARGWRCLSCEAEALDTRLPSTLSRYRSTPADSAPPLPVPLSRSATLPVDDPVEVTRPPTRCSTVVVRPSELPRFPSSERCSTLEEMLSHRAMRPLAKAVRVGDQVTIASIARCDGLKPKNLGQSGTVIALWVPEMSKVKTTWCRLEVVRESANQTAVHVDVPLHNTAHFKVCLRPGDEVEAHRHARRSREERSQATFRATVLELPKSRPHEVMLSFSAGDEASIPLHWVVRAEMSAWTQVLRQAPHSTVMFLLCDLQLAPGTPQDERELEDRLRRDFEPHGRFRYLGASDREVETESPKTNAGPSTLSRRSTVSSLSGSGTGPASPQKRGARMAIGDRGKVLSFDLEAMQAEVVPDRKKHLRLRVGLEELEPDPSVLPVAATSGPTSMHAFGEDPPLLAAAKRKDVRELRRLLSGVRRSEMATTLLDDVVDADGHLLFHAVVYAQSAEMWRVVWSALDGNREENVQALGAADDWGRSPLWIALEQGHVQLCSMLLNAKASPDDEAPVLPEIASGAAGHDFCGGPGMVAQGADFEVCFYRPASSCGLHLASGKVGGGFVVARTSGEAAHAGVVAGDVLTSVGGEPAADLTSGHLAHRLATHPRPFTVGFRKGSGLFVRALHRACELGHDEIARLLLSHEADPQWQDMCGRSAMDRAVWRLNHQEGEHRLPFQRCITVLTAAGASEEDRVQVFDAHGSRHRFRAPLHWGQSSEEMQLQGRFWMRLHEETSGDVLEHLQRVLDRSMCGTGAGKVRTVDRRGAMPQRLQLVRAQRIENVDSLCEYLQRRHILREAVFRDSTEQLTDCRVKVNYSKLSGRNEEILAPELNEVYLFHGTSPKGARGIARDDFLLSLAGSAGGDAFGAGIYFAEDCIKSDEYTEEAQAGDDCAGLRPLLLCRVLLGRVLISEDRDVSWEVSQVMQGQFDSLVPDRRAAVGTYREFVVFDENQAYAEYILWYRRRYS